MGLVRVLGVSALSSQAHDRAVRFQAGPDAAVLDSPAHRPIPSTALLCLNPFGPEWGDGAARAELPGVARNLRRLIEHARASGWTVVHVLVTDTWDSDRPWGALAGCLARSDERIVHRQSDSALADPDFAELCGVADHAEIVVAGVSAQRACLAVCVDGFVRGRRIRVATDALVAEPDELGRLERFAELPAVRRAGVSLSAVEAVVGEAPAAAPAAPSAGAEKRLPPGVGLALALTLSIALWALVLGGVQEAIRLASRFF
jgi:hypothetical protein